MNGAECDRSTCARTPVVRVRFQTQGGRWWYYCDAHCWPLDESAMMWGAKGKRARPMPVADVEWLG